MTSLPHEAPITPENRGAVLEHLKNPLVPNNSEVINELVSYPLKNPHQNGGLLPHIHDWAKTNDQELYAASLKHREKSRVKISAVLKASLLYAKSATLPLNKKEKEALLQGIALTKPKDEKTKYLRITRQKGSSLSEEFQALIEELQDSLTKVNGDELLSLTLTKALQINELRKALDTNQRLREKYMARQARQSSHPDTI